MKRFLVLVVAVILAACSQSGTEYVGKWQSVKYSNFTMEIVRNGDNYLASMTQPVRGLEGPLETTKIPATLKDGQLQVATAFGSMNISHVKGNDTLLVPGMAGSDEFKRVK